MLQMYGCYTRALDCLRDERIYVVKLRLGKLYIHTSQHVDGSRHCLPVECDILSYVKVQILVKRLYGLLRTAVAIGCIDLVVFAVAYGQICISEHADQLYLT